MQPDDLHLLMLCRYVEANPLRAGLVRRAEQWRWSGLAFREGRGGDGDRRSDDRDRGRDDGPALRPVAWPVDRPRNWIALVNEALPARQAEAVRTSLARQRPLGAEPWVLKTAKRLGLEFTLRPRGRPKKVNKE